MHQSLGLELGLKMEVVAYPALATENFLLGLMSLKRYVTVLNTSVFQLLMLQTK